jgi:hypothetical protein
MKKYFNFIKKVFDFSILDDKINYNTVQHRKNIEILAKEYGGDIVNKPSNESLTLIIVNLLERIKSLEENIK